MANYLTRRGFVQAAAAGSAALAWLGAHQVRQSPIYGTGKPGGFHPASTGERFRLHFDRIVKTDLFVVGVAALALVAPPAADPQRFLLAVILAIYAWAGLTLFVPRLRFMGEGNKYLKYAMPPILAYVAIEGMAKPSLWSALILLPILIWWMRYYYLTVRDLSKSSLWVGDYNEDLKTVAESLRALPNPRVMCLSTHMADLLAYHSRVPVFWGTHGYGFKRVEPFFPVIRRPIQEFVQTHGLTHLVLDGEYARPQELQLDDIAREILQSGRYHLFEFQAVGAIQ